MAARGESSLSPAPTPRIAAPDLSDAAGEVYLDDTWALWFHDPDDPDWTNASYVQIAAISSANNFWAVQSLLSDKVQNGMFFLMREHVFPCWDDPYNAQGGCLSVRVPNQEATKFWEDLCTSMLSDNLVNGTGREGKPLPAPCQGPCAGAGAGAGADAEAGAGTDDAGEPPKVHDLVNGLSVTPKGGFCVFKLWLGEAAPKEPCRYAIPPFQGQALYKSHAACMLDASAKAVKPAPSKRAT
jgi:hypothetical protein